PMNSASRRTKGISAFGPSMPPHARGGMVAQPWRGFTRGLLDVVTGRRGPSGNAANAGLAPAAWEQAARLRRRVLMALIALSTALATTVLAWSQPTYEHPLLQWIQIGLFSLLFAWVSAGCITAVTGVWVLVKGDQPALSKNTASNRPLSANARTAVIMPICNEDVSTVFAGLRATCESLATTGADRLFDVFILSDSSDPAVRAAELAAWSELRGTLNSD